MTYNIPQLLILVSFFIVIGYFFLCFVWVILLMFCEKLEGIRRITCGYCGKAVTLDKKTKHCWHCRNLILFNCALCGKEGEVDGYDMYELLHKTGDPICKKCKAYDLRHLCLEKNISLAERLWGWDEFVKSIITSPAGILFGTLSIICIIIDKYRDTSTCVIFIGVPLFLLISSIVGFVKINRKKKTIYNKQTIK